MQEEKEESVIPQITAEELLAQVAVGAEIYSELSADFIQEQLVFYGKSLYEWATEMTIEIPEDLNEDTYRRKLAEIANKLQLATNYYSAASAMEDTVSGGAKLSKNDIVKAIVESYNEKGAKRPAASVIERLADAHMSDTVSTAIAAKVVRDFWKKRIEAIDKVGSKIEQIGISLHVEAKHLTR